MYRIGYLIQKEFRQILREKAFIGLIFGMPFIQIVILGFAVSTDVRHVSIAFLDRDHSRFSRKIADAFSVTESFTGRGALTSERQAKELIDSGVIQAAVVIPPGFERDLLSGREPALQMLIDGVDGNSAGIALAYASQIVARLQQEAAAEARGGPPSPGAAAPVTLAPRMWYNPELESRYNIVPGIIGILVTMITAFLTGMAIVREKEIGTLEQLMVTPIKKHELILGKVIPFAVVGFMLMNVGIAAAGLLFGLWMEGSLFSLYLMSLLFMLSTLGLGIFASTMARTQQQAMFVTWFFSIFALLLSGFFIPIENMPKIIQAVTVINPLRYFMVAIREIYLKGTPVLYLWKEALFMLLFGLTVIIAASLRFRKRIA
ncbi:ABC transporter permease [bacterium]|nr:ABC transporter permease [bacterium]